MDSWGGTTHWSLINLLKATALKTTSSPCPHPRYPNLSAVSTPCTQPQGQVEHVLEHVQVPTAAGMESPMKLQFSFSFETPF